MATQERRRPKPSDYFSDWKQREALAESMIPMIGKLYRQNVHILLYDTPLVNHSVLEIMQAHREVRQVEQNELSEFETTPVVEALTQFQDLGSARIDIGRLAVQYEQRTDTKQSISNFLKSKLAPLIGKHKKPITRHRNVVLYGFGRIGRLLGRILIENTGGGDALRLRAFVNRPKGDQASDLEKRASLFVMDSVHGPFQGTVRVDTEESCIIANGNKVHAIYADNPEEINYRQLGLDDVIVVDNTGVWRDDAGLRRHLRAPDVSQVLLTAPAKGAIQNIVYGINHQSIEQQKELVAAASCTTNAIVPPLKVLNDEYGIHACHIETVHAYTNDQNLIDNYHKSKRRGRSAALNLVLTETGAAKAVEAVLPELRGKITGNAIRVPVPNVSMAILNLRLARKVSRNEINEFMRQVALHSPLQEQIGYTNSPEVVSSDFIGSRYVSVFDSTATIVGDEQCVLYFWYDNEYGYAWQVYRVLEEMAGVRYPIYPTKP
jgi:glyceraldehyde 3-phosphate dehydrogenase